MSTSKSDTAPDNATPMSTEDYEKGISRICRCLSSLLPEIKTLEQQEKDTPQEKGNAQGDTGEQRKEKGKERKVSATWSNTIGKAFFDSGPSLFPLRIFRILIRHRLYSGFRGDDEFSVRRVMKTATRIRGTYFTLEDAHKRADVLKASVVAKDGLVDKEAEEVGAFEENEKLRWAMMRLIEKPEVAQEVKHMVACYVERIDVVGPESNDPKATLSWDMRDVDSEADWGDDSDQDETVDVRKADGISSAALEYVHDNSKWSPAKIKGKFRLGIPMCKANEDFDIRLERFQRNPTDLGSCTGKTRTG